MRGHSEDLLRAEVNLEYAGRYLKGAYLVADGDLDAAVMWYARGYYYEARGPLPFLVETGLRDREVRRDLPRTVRGALAPPLASPRGLAHPP